MRPPVVGPTEPMGVDEGYMIVFNEMSRILALTK